MKLIDLKINNVKNPMGFHTSPISLSWRVEEAKMAKKQEWAQLTIWKKGELIFDSGKDKQMNSCDYVPLMKPEPCTEYRCHLVVCGENGDMAEAECWFETGKMQQPWEAKWITTRQKEHASVILTNQFFLEKTATARAYICGLGLYELYINGKKVGDEYLTPGYHSYDFHLQVQTYDVTNLLQIGHNEVEIWLADGWFKGRFGFDGGYTNLYGEKQYAIAELQIKYEDGSTEVIGTNDSWQAKKSPVLFSNIYDGERYDANTDRTEVVDTVIEQTPSGCGALSDRYSLPIKKKEILLPIQIGKTPKGETVIDFGQNLTGWVEFECDIPKGRSVVLTASEILQEGCFYHENLRTAKTEFVYISNGEKAHVRPHFTFYGFRYMKIECKTQEGLSNFAAYHLRSDFEQIGSIHTGNEKVNQLFQNALWSQKDNFLDVPTDCPQRDERMGWTGDAQVFSETACYNMEVPAFFRKYLWDMRAEQSVLGGSVPNIVPRLKQGLVAGHGASPWADAAVLIPWNVYLHYGSETLLAETYPGMKAWVDYQSGRTKGEGMSCLLSDGFHFGDWLALDQDDPGPFGKTDPLYIANAYYYHCVSIVSQAAIILRKTEEAKEYETLADEIQQEIQNTYFDKEGLCICKTQTASALAIAFNLVPTQKRREGQLLFDRVKKNQGHLNTGFVGTPLLCPALTESGNHQTAMDLLLQEGYPSWLYSVNLGATTIWERWNSVLEDGLISSEGMNSLNHYSYGSVVAWIYKDVCGIRPKEAGFRKASITPHPDIRLKFAQARLDTASGKYTSRWEYQEDGSVIYEIEVPFHAEAIITLPAGTYQSEGQNVTGGECFTVPTGKYLFCQK